MPSRDATTIAPYEQLLILKDVSHDAVRPYLHGLGLDTEADQRFVGVFRSLPHQLIERDPAEVREPWLGAELRAFFDRQETAVGGETVRKFLDWCLYIYPNATELQTQIGRWKLVISRRGRDGARDPFPAPPLIQSVSSGFLALLGEPEVVIAPVSDYDRHAVEDAESRGLSAYAWLTPARVNRKFLLAWHHAMIREQEPGSLERAHEWATAVAAAMTLRTSGLQPPEACLVLPPTLRPGYARPSA